MSAEQLRLVIEAVDKATGGEIPAVLLATAVRVTIEAMEERS